MAWRRDFHFARWHLDASATLPTRAGEAVHHGKDRANEWVSLTPAVLLSGGVVQVAEVCSREDLAELV
ncbi:hypothetical protein ACI2LO_32125 [Streptomyces sp. NPDC033754]|uniref:hypothetical protein n=1 Tax=unclassified Streptomyces TaxID=2593676 RepID=UPI0033FD9A84